MMKALDLQKTCAIALAIGLLGTVASQAADSQYVYIGTHGAQGSSPDATTQGIYAVRLNAKTGELSLVGMAAELARATWLTLHPSLPVIYSVAEAPGGWKADSNIVSFAIDASTGELRKMNEVGSGGRDATIMDLDGPSKTLIVGNHGSGSVSAIPLLDDGSLGPVASVQNDYGTGPTPRQKSPAAHGVAVDPSHKFVLVADFSADRVFVYHFDGSTRALTPADPPFEAVPAGSAPRHLAFHPNGRFVFLDSELSGDLRSYKWDAKKGRLQLVQAISPYPADFRGEKSAAEVTVSPDGRFVYLSLRGEDNSIVVYAVNSQQGTLREIQRLSAQGKMPWSFGIDLTGRWMLVTNETSNTVIELKIDTATGMLSSTDQTITIPKPVTVAFYAPSIKSR